MPNFSILIQFSVLLGISIIVHGSIHHLEDDDNGVMSSPPLSHRFHSHAYKPAKVTMKRTKDSNHDRGIDSDEEINADFASLLSKEKPGQQGEARGLNFEDAGLNMYEELKKRYKIPRVYAKPVESILELANMDSSELFILRHPDYYSILGIPQTSSMKDINVAYRRAAMILHPDKNPHPDAGKAFEILGTAYQKLSDSEFRDSYDKKLLRRSKKKFSLKHWGGRIKTVLQNQFDRFFLLLARLHRGEFYEEVFEFRNWLRERYNVLIKASHQFFLRVKFAPYFSDKISLVIEQFWKQKLYLAILALLTKMI